MIRPLKMIENSKRFMSHKLQNHLIPNRIQDNKRYAEVYLIFMSCTKKMSFKH